MAASFDRRKLALGVTLLAVIGAMAFSMVNSSLLHGQGKWYEAGFDDLSAESGRHSLIDLCRRLRAHLHPRQVSGDRTGTATGDGAGRSSGLPSLVPLIRAPVLYPAAFSGGKTPVPERHGSAQYLAADRWLQGMAVIDIRRRLLVLGAMAISLPPSALLQGHPEDLIAIEAMLYGLVAALDGEDISRRVGPVALAFQFFALLAVPFALIFLSRRKWLTAIWPMILVPLTFLIVMHTKSCNRPRQYDSCIHQKVYDVSGYIAPTWKLNPGVGAFIRALVVIVAIPAAIIVARHLPQ